MVEGPRPSEPNLAGVFIRKTVVRLVHAPTGASSKTESTEPPVGDPAQSASRSRGSARRSHSLNVPVLLPLGDRSATLTSILETVPLCLPQSPRAPGIPDHPSCVLPSHGVPSPLLVRSVLRGVLLYQDFRFGHPGRYSIAESRSRGSVLCTWSISDGQLVTVTHSDNPHVINDLRSPSEMVIGESIC